jgi:aryl-alcohol dehydrogenase-like predicted oxidoreductase
MEYRNLGRSDLKVSIVGLGCNNLGRSVDAKATASIVARCVELGVNFFDCADVYGGRGKAEELLGAAAKAHPRDKLVIATKVGGGMHDGVHREGASRRYVIPAVEACLRRLGLETIDLLQIHFPDPNTPIEETLGALDDLVKSGKVRHVGCCNFSAAAVEEAASTAKARKLTPFISAQNRHNVLEARIPKELARACEKNGLGFLPFYPLAAGLLTGKYKAGEPPPPGTRLSVPNQFYDGLLNDTNFARLAKLEKFAKDHGRSILELGIGWLASQGIVGSIICGATKPEQVEANVKASGWRLTPQQMQEVDALAGLS